MDRHFTSPVVSRPARARALGHGRRGHGRRGPDAGGAPEFQNHSVKKSFENETISVPSKAKRATFQVKPTSGAACTWGVNGITCQLCPDI